jgi:hypothetical protein
MSSEQFDALLKKLPKIAKAVNAFKSDQVQQDVFHTLLKSIESIPQVHKSNNEGKEGKELAGGAKRIEQVAPSESDEFNATSFANALKAKQTYDKISRGLLHKHDLWKKVEFILSEGKNPMTSGQVAGVLRDLGIKTGQPSVSRCLGDHDGDLIRSSPRKGGKPSYKLSAPALTSFREWLHENVK